MSSEQGRETPRLIERFTKWKHEPTLMQLKQDYQDAKPYHDTEVAQITSWLDNLNVRGSAKPKKRDGYSAAQPKLIRKQAEWRYAALSEPFLSRPDIFQVSPVGPSDVKGAHQNSLLLNNQFNTKLKKVSFIDEYVRTAVDEGTVIVFVGWESCEEEVTEDVPNVKFYTNPEFAPTLQELLALQEADPTAFAELPEELQEAVELSLEQGVPVEPVIEGTKQVTRMKLVKNQPCLEIEDTRNVLIDPTCKGDISKAGFLIRHFDSSLSALKKDGRYKNLEHILVDQNTILGEPDHASPNDGAKNFNFSDQARKKFVVFEYWGFRDLDGSGIVRPFVAAWVGNTLIRMEENPFPDKAIPAVKVQYLPVRKQSLGEPDGALLEENQSIVGAMTRGAIDLVGRSANAQQGIRKDALDPVNRRKFEQGLDYEFNPTVQDARQAIHMHEYPQIPDAVPFMINLMNQDAESITGVKAFHSGLTGDSLGTANATGVRGALDAASKREVGILRRLSEGLIEIARKIIAMNKEFLSEEEVVRITEEEFVTIMRDDLQGNLDLRLSISTAEEDNQKAQELAFVLQTAGPTEDPRLRQMVLAQIMRLRKMPDLAKMIEEYEPQPDPMQQQIQMLTMQKLAAEIEELNARARERLANAGLHSSRAGMEAEKAANIRSDTDQKNLNFVEQESGVTQARALEQTGKQAESQGKLAVLQHELDMQSEQGVVAADAAKTAQKDRSAALKAYIKMLDRRDQQAMKQKAA